MTSCPWSEYPQATISFCEARRCAWLVEPSNACSNLGYVIIGILILKSAPRRLPFWIIGVASILIGLGSFAFHGTHTRAGELADVGAMYLLTALGIMFCARRWWDMSDGALAAGYLAIVVGSIAAMIGFHTNGIIMFAVQMNVAIFGELYLYGKGIRVPSYRDQKLMLAAFGAAFFIWNLDKWDVLCRPDNHLVTGHAVWHVLTAVTIWFFYRQQRLVVAYMDATSARSRRSS